MSRKILLLVLLNYLFVGHNHIYGQDNAQQKKVWLKDQTIELETHRIATLYKGNDRVLVADSLDVIGIDRLVKQEKNVWQLEWGFEHKQDSLMPVEYWLQLRSTVNAAEVFLNGKMLFSNGEVGTSAANELAGKCLVRKRIPHQFIKDGENKVKVRFSNFNYQNGTIFKDLAIGTYQEFQHHSTVMSTAPFLLSGIFLFALFINLALYFSLNRKRIFLLLVVMFLLEFLLMSHESLYWHGLLRPNSFILNTPIKSWLEYLPYVLLSLVVVSVFKFERKYAYFSIIGSLLLCIVCKLTLISMSLGLSLPPLVLAGLAVIKKKENSVITFLALSILSICVATDHLNWLDDWTPIYRNFMVTSFVFKLDVLGMVGFALVMVFTSAKSILQQTLSLTQAKLKLERLEHQFLQKLIQPHFLMNSLMALQHLVSKRPQEAGEMIEALAEVFYLFITLSKLQQVSMRQELALCHAYLQLMSIQQQASYRLCEKNLDDGDEIPPAIFLTLIENGITHGYAGNQDAYFELSKELLSNGFRYRLFNDSQIKHRVGHQTSGTGLKYVESRLEECYGQNWTCHSGTVPKGWEVIITIQEKP